MELKPSALASWTFFAILLFLSIFYMLAGNVMKTMTGLAPYGMLAACEAVAFGAPLLFLTRYRPLHGLANLRLKKIKKHYMPFTLSLSASIIFLSFTLNYLSSLLSSGERDAGIQTLYPVSSGSTPVQMIAAIAAVAIIPALLEELLVRGVLYSFYEKRGALTAMLVTAASFAMLHIYPEAFLASFFAGLAYAYMLHVTGSVWPGVLAHLANNLYSMLISWLAANFAFNPYWDYFLAANIVLFFVFLYIALGSLMELLRDNAVPQVTIGKNGFKRSIVGAVNSPGYILFASVFLFRMALIVFLGI